jgi:NADH-quinone oxidoreductase subunit N
MLIGNLSAIVQDNIKRMLAYSSIAHAGYMLLSILSLGKNGNESVHNALLFYSAAYSLASIISFTVLHQVALASGTESLAGFNGLFKKNRTAAIAMSVALISLAGIPPLAGFFGKYFLFYKALQGGHVYVILFAILASLAGIAYYLRIVIAMFTGEPDASSELQLSSSHKLLLGLCTLGLIILGVMPGLLVNIF